ncbi:MAG: phosphoribosyltransferase family protein [bacterium]|nr:phosphoribosyltransferase family protein [bacterium]
MCGVVGVYGVENATELTIEMMKALQHRGQQSSGCVLVGQQNEVIYKRELGIILNLIQSLETIQIPEKVMYGIGQLRYGTTGSRDKMENAQPIYLQNDNYEIYLDHNGDTPLYKEMKSTLQNQGVEFNTTSDTEIIAKFISLSKEVDPIQAILEGLSKYHGTYAITMLLKDKDGWRLLAARDHSGNRPLMLGRRDNDWLVASEDVAFEAVGGVCINEIQPGELLIISKNNLKTKIIPHDDVPSKQLHKCIFENIYFSFPNSKTYGFEVRAFQEELGRIVARKLRNLILNDDVITNIPDSSNIFMDGFSKELCKFPTREIIRKHSYITRSFTEANQIKRNSVIRDKFSLSKSLVKGKRVWITDDSIVRGNTSRKMIRAIKSHGATWVGMISSAPPIIGQCRKGIDFEDELVAVNYLNWKKYEEFIDCIRKDIEADYLFYTTIEELHEALRMCKADPASFCYGCFTGKEPVFGAW